jgi:hypothetical protein
MGHALSSSRRGMRDYKRIRRRRSGHHKYIRPADTLALHRATTSFLDAQLAAPSALPTVVVTHHAPHPLSLADANMDLRWCYASDAGPQLRRRSGGLGKSLPNAKRNDRLLACPSAATHINHIECRSTFEPHAD